MRETTEALIHKVNAARDGGEKGDIVVRRSTNLSFKKQQKTTPNEDLRKIMEMPEHSFCADCSAADPKWVSTNCGVFLCLECSGIHRSLGVHISKMRSVGLDKWEVETMQEMILTTEKLGNKVWEGSVPPDWKSKKPLPNSSREDKEIWIMAKYQDRKFLLSNLDFEVRKLLNLKSRSTIYKQDPSRSSGNFAGKRLYKEGYLIKQGTKVKNWRKRWFVLKNDTLTYYKVRGDSLPAGEIDLKQAVSIGTTVIPGKEKESAFEIVTEGRTYPIIATSANLDDWILLLNKAKNL